MHSNRYTNDVDNNRPDRLRPFLLICATAFGLYAVCYAFGGHVNSALVCVGVAFVSLASLAVAVLYPKQSNWVAHSFLSLAVVCLLIYSLESGWRVSHSLAFLCCAALLAANLLRIRAAFLWTGVALGAVLFLDYLRDPALITPAHRTKLVVQLLNFSGLTIAIYVLSQQAERFLKRFAGGLLSLSDELQERTRLLRMAEEVAGVGHWRLVVGDGLITYSQEALKICGLELPANEPQPLYTLLSCFPDDQASQLKEALSLIRADADTSFLLNLSFTKHGRERFVTVRGVCEHDHHGEPMAVFGILKDDTESRQAAAQLREKAAALQKLAAFDVLTGLANRYRFQHELEHSIAHAERSSTQAALLLIDMDGFKDINDTLGHKVGDEILQMIAGRLESCATSNDIVARLGGDEFTLILNGVSGEGEARQRANSIATTISQPYCLDDKELCLNASIGVALYPQHSDHMDELLAFADTAMYEAKSQKQPLLIYDKQMTDALVRRRQLEGELAQALVRNEFHLVYQPQYRIDGTTILGFEALVRWQRQGETVSPLEFIPVLEQTGAIHSVGEWILQEACRQAQEWVSQGHDLTISVNISPVQFRDRNFVHRVLAALDATGLDPKRLDLEVTENVFIKEVESTATTLFQLKDIGISISIDDFGTGYSSLAYLRHFPIDRLKIDRAFVKDIPRPDDGIIASTIVGLGHNLEMRVLAEGVETDEQLFFLYEELCDECQGFLLSKPLSPDNCLRLLTGDDGEVEEKPSLAQLRTTLRPPS